MTTKKTAAKRRADRKFAFSMAATEMHETLFEFHRMAFNLISILVHSNGGHAQPPSDAMFYHLKISAKRIVERIEKAEEHLAPYIEKHLVTNDKP